MGWEIKSRLNPTGAGTHRGLVGFPSSWGMQGILWMWEGAWKIPLTCSCGKMGLIQQVGPGLENTREFCRDEHQCHFLIRNSTVPQEKKKRGKTKLFFGLEITDFNEERLLQKFSAFYGKDKRKKNIQNTLRGEESCKNSCLSQNI